MLARGEVDPAARDEQPERVRAEQPDARIPGLGGYALFRRQVLTAEFAEPGRGDEDTLHTHGGALRQQVRRG